MYVMGLALQGYGNFSLEMPDKESSLAGWSDDDFLQRLELLNSESYTRKVLADVAMWRRNGNKEAVAKVAASVRARLFDLSAFMGEFKHKFYPRFARLCGQPSELNEHFVPRQSTWFNHRHGRWGSGKIVSDTLS